MHAIPMFNGSLTSLTTTLLLSLHAISSSLFRCICKLAQTLNLVFAQSDADMKELLAM